ncbi:uncharacterized protein PG986_012687 [Apiospora aurea]|uniref:Heterokaryon incompatibility domain-containing protein n=1 Tax=Apiospora aurea TaxID=335848 RepID=A0ABR1Q0P8_9PEZI
MEPSLPPGGARKRGTFVDECASPARKRKLLDASASSDLALCDRCRQIQWEDLAAIPPASRIGRKAADLLSVDRDALSESQCPVCRLLAAITPPSLDGQHCRLVALSSSLAILGRQVRAPERVDYSDCTVLYPVLEAKFADKTAGQRISRDWYEGGCLALVASAGNENQIPVTGPRRISSKVDFGLVKRWWADCKTHHPAATCEPGVGGSSDVEGLRVIDCYSEVFKTVEAPSTCQYVALSYVWGKPSPPTPQGESGNFKQAVEVIPRVIIDAITLTKSLGEQYLWVDKLCIDQIDGPMRASQIAQMDKIYAHAYLTIVAAAGHDASYGLPGVGDKQRHPQGHIPVTENVDLIQIFPHTSAELDSATWARRGWTYQEGYLSPRRLVFTDQQVSFLCNVAHHAESIQKPKRLSRIELKASKSNFLDMIPSAALSSTGRGRGDSKVGRQWEDLKQEQLVNYTRRQLTNESDSLNAILGLFRALQPSGIRHLHGVPVRKVRKGECSWLEFPLAWHHEAEVSRRRPGFPSWSWSGWEGGIRMSEFDICVPGDCDLGLVRRDSDTVFPLRDWLNHDLRDPDLSSVNASSLLSVTALAVQVQCVRKSWTELNKTLSNQSRLAGMSFRDGVHAVLPIGEGVTQMAYAYMDEDIPLVDRVLGLVLRPPWSSRKNAILLLKQAAQQEQHYRRIGLVRVSGFTKTRPAAVGDSDPQTVYVDSDGSPLEEVDQVEELPLWLEEAVERTITIS